MKIDEVIQDGWMMFQCTSVLTDSGLTGCE